MTIDNFRYILDMDNGSLHIVFNNDETIKVNHYNNGIIHVGINKDNDLVYIIIEGFARYAIDTIADKLFRKLIK